MSGGDSALLLAFGQRFSHEPTFIVRCPGRVNLIGEHIDYSGYGVLPMAIEQSVSAAVSIGDGRLLQLDNVDPHFKCYSADKNVFDIDVAHPQWQHYFLCGYRGMLEQLHMAGDVPNGMEVMVRGDVPPGAGLSSSSALVCCAAIATLRAQTGQDFDLLSKAEVAELCAKCERYIGTEGGGMDQAISMLAEEGMAKKIDFSPLRSAEVRLPSSAAFFVLHSGVSVNKAAGSLYNERVVECRLAAQLIAKTKHIANWRDIRKLGELQKALDAPPLNEMEAIVEATLKKEPYAKTEILQLLQVSEEDFQTLSLSPNTLHMQEFKLRDRAFHVFSEANRVEKFAALCSNKEDAVDDVLDQLGRLMSDSHRSCAVDYECSCAELDELVAACLESGARGARLTGAGWGGCVVALIDRADVAQFRDTIKGAFYDKSEQRQQHFHSSVFPTRPAAGASIRLHR